jgi:hypothetical protein
MKNGKDWKYTKSNIKDHSNAITMASNATYLGDGFGGMLLSERKIFYDGHILM